MYPKCVHNCTMLQFGNRAAARADTCADAEDKPALNTGFSVTAIHEARLAASKAATNFSSSTNKPTPAVAEAVDVLVAVE